MPSSRSTQQRGVPQIWFGVLAAIAGFGILINALVAWSNENGAFSTGLYRFLNTFTFFTILSNALVAISAFLLATNHASRSDLFRTIWLSGLIAITITGIVYHTVLAGLHELTRWGTIGDIMVHTISPIMSVAGFLLIGPRGLIDTRLIKFTFIYPACWAVFTLIRGEIVDWYPYPFIDVIRHDYPTVFLNVALVGLLYGVVGFGLKFTDDWLERRGR